MSKVRKIKSQAFRNKQLVSSHNIEAIEGVIKLFREKEIRDIGFPFLDKIKKWSYIYKDGWHVYYPCNYNLNKLLRMNTECVIKHQEYNTSTMIIYPF